MQLTSWQQNAVSAGGSTFLHGPAGVGKTTALHHRLLRLLQEGEPAYTILVLIAEEEHRTPFLDFLHAQNAAPYADLKITTYTYLAREMVSLFWPLVARPAGFQRPYQPPTSLSYDLAQLLMWRIVTPMLREGAFANLRLRPQQLVSQLLDTLNRAALNGLTLEQGFERTLSAWAGPADEVHYLHDAQIAARRFRNHCLAYSLLDLSLMVEVFDTQLVENQEFHRYFSERFRHLIVDNVDEQTPAGQGFIASLTGKVASMAIAFDRDGGYKRFLSADPAGAEKFRQRCDQTIELSEADSHTTSPPLVHLANLVQNYLTIGGPRRPVGDAQQAILGVITGRYRREMVAQLPLVLQNLIYEQGVAPRDIAIVTPYLDGALRYSLEQALGEAGIPYYLFKRRSSPRDEPRIRAWLTWLALAHPEWEMWPSPYDVAEALTLSIFGLDPARAQLLVEHLYRADEGILLPAGDTDADLVRRIGEAHVQMVERLRLWLEENGGKMPLDVFLHRLFSELLALPPYQPEPDLAGAAVCNWLVRTAGNLRQAAPNLGLQTNGDTGRTFIQGIYQGLVTADPPELGEPPDIEGVMISTIYGHLLAGNVVRVQVWLETAATGWWDIPRQPLSNAFVLTPDWEPERPWTMDEDFLIRNQLLWRIVRGLTARCRDGIVLANSDLDRRGQRQDGVLWRALQPLLPRPEASPEAEAAEF